MASNIWCVRPESKLIEGLKWRDELGVEHTIWIRVKKRLTVGEDRRMKMAGWGGIKGERGSKEPTAEIGINWRDTAFAKVEVYLLDWSLEDDERRKMPIERDIIESLHEDLFNVIDAAIAKHVEEIEEAKKSQSTIGAP